MPSFQSKQQQHWGMFFLLWNVQTRERLCSCSPPWLLAIHLCGRRSVSRPFSSRLQPIILQQKSKFSLFSQRAELKENVIRPGGGRVQVEEFSESCIVDWSQWLVCRSWGWEAECARTPYYTPRCKGEKKTLLRLANLNNCRCAVLIGVILNDSKIYFFDHMHFFYPVQHSMLQDNLTTTAINVRTDFGKAMLRNFRAVH